MRNPVAFKPVFHRARFYPFVFGCHRHNYITN
jgi:hypothetical protein